MIDKYSYVATQFLYKAQTNRVGNRILEHMGLIFCNKTFEINETRNVYMFLLGHLSFFMVMNMKLIDLLNISLETYRHIRYSSRLNWKNENYIINYSYPN